MSRIYAARAADGAPRRDAWPHATVQGRVRDARERPGQALPPTTRAALDARLGANLSGVRVHRDASAARAAEALGARAFTVGQDVFFGRGHWDPNSPEGMRLLTHEAAHTLQQRGATETDTLAISRPGDAAERQVDRAVAGDPSALTVQPAASVQRDVLGAAIHMGREARPSVESIRNVANPIYRGFKAMLGLSIASSSGLIVPPANWLSLIGEFTLAHPMDGLLLALALTNFPVFHQGGLILDLQPAASAMTMDHDVFVRGRLSLATCVHELVHVGQYDVLGVSAFLVSYFGMSAATIAAGWATGTPVNPMRSSPHESQAYDLEARFVAWYASAHGGNAHSVYA